MNGIRSKNTFINHTYKNLSSTVQHVTVRAQRSRNRPVYSLI